MPPLHDPRLLRTIVIDGDDDCLEWMEILRGDLSERDPALANELARLTSRFQMRQAARRLDEVATGGFFRRLLVRGATR